MPLCRLRKQSIQHTDPQYPTLSYSLSIGVVEIEGELQYGEVIQQAKDTLAEARNFGTGSVALLEDGQYRLVQQQDTKLQETCAAQ